jgi:polysaccharide biosynthesis protein PelG
MAGIGFKLLKLVENESFFKKAKAYIFASIITSGPWILSILCLSLIGIISGLFLTGEKFAIISITIVYTFAFTLIATAPVQFILTRYLADKEYLEQKEKMIPALFSALGLTVIISLAITLPWYLLNEGSVYYRIISISLFIIISCIWTMMDFLSCLKNYMKIVRSFFGGSILSVILMYVFGTFYDLEGALLGYTLGQFSIFIMLILGISKEFKFNSFFSSEYFKYIKLFPYIMFTGLFYNLGLWADKLLGWIVLGENVYGNFRALTVYDTPVFIAYLSIIPSLAYFLIQSETKFFLTHRKFFDSITKESLTNILQYKNELWIILKRSIRKLFLIQIAVSSCGSILAHFIGGLFGLSEESILILRVLFLAAGFQVLFLYTIIFMMYFDLSRLSFYIVLVFFILNTGLNILFITFPVLPLGSGYLISIFVSFLTGLGLLFYSVKDIEYKIFMRQEN